MKPVTKPAPENGQWMPNPKDTKPAARIQPRAGINTAEAGKNDRHH
ncbi:MAG: hypothetical protein NTZ64_01980 [Polaromonas sp.]|nr:hypothetical protein [Polaromonas sp.]